MGPRAGAPVKETRELQRLSLAILCQIGFLLIAALHCRGDTPVEQYYVKLHEIPASILKDAQGAVTILNQDPSYAEKYLGKHIEAVKLRTFQKNKDGFRETGFIELEESQPLSGWLFDGTRVRRFPVVDRKGEYLKIIHDVKDNRRSWILIEDAAHLMPKAWGSSLRLDWFGGRHLRDETDVEVFGLLTDKYRRLYREPDRSAESQKVSSETELLGSSRGMLTGNLVIIEQRDSFARIGIRDPCGDRATRPLGWMLLRDDEGRLNVWPHIGLSC